jgi:archaellum component FlaC
MSNQNHFDPFDSYKKMVDQMFNQWDGMYKNMANSKEFVGLASKEMEAYALFTELWRKHQERILQELNLPSRKDLETISELAIQTDDKLDGLEEQMWSLSDAAAGTKEDVQKLMEAVKDLAKETSQVKRESTALKNQYKQWEKSLADHQQQMKDEIADLKQTMIELFSNSMPAIEPESKRQAAATAEHPK